MTAASVGAASIRDCSVTWDLFWAANNSYNKTPMVGTVRDQDLFTGNLLQQNRLIICTSSPAP